MTFKNIFTLALVFTISFACNNSPENNLENQTKNSLIKEPSDYELKIKKLNALAESFNGFSTSAFKTYQSYISSFGSDADNYKQNEVSEILEVSANDVYKLKSLEDVLEIPVLEELNSLITSYKINARAFSVAINSCERYYSKKGYKKDNFENGKGMHKPVVEIYAKFSVIDSLLREKSGKVLAKIEQEHLNTLKKNGFEVEYLSIIGKNDADELHSLLIATNYKDLKVEELNALHNKIKMTYDKLNELKEAGSNQFKVSTRAHFNNFEQLYQAFDELYLRKKEKNKFSKKELKKLKSGGVAANGVEGSIPAVINAYKNLCDSFKDVKTEGVYINPKIANTNAEIANNTKMLRATK